MALTQILPLNSATACSERGLRYHPRWPSAAEEPVSRGRTPSLTGGTPLTSYDGGVVDYLV